MRTVAEVVVARRHSAVLEIEGVCLGWRLSGTDALPAGCGGDFRMEFGVWEVFGTKHGAE